MPQRLSLVALLFSTAVNAARFGSGRPREGWGLALSFWKKPSKGQAPSVTVAGQYWSIAIGGRSGVAFLSSPDRRGSRRIVDCRIWSSFWLTYETRTKSLPAA